MKGWIEIFRTGTHTSQNGQVKKVTKGDLDRMVGSYDASEHEAPLVVGHPKNNDPAWGWAKKLKRSGENLLALPHQVEPKFAEMVEAGRFKKRSISIYPDGRLRHIGFLGAQPPAVKGLSDIAFGDEEAEIYEYGEKEAENMPTVEELKKQLADEKEARKAADKKAAQLEKKANKSDADFAEHKKKTARQDIDNFVEQGVKDGKMLPGWKDDGIAEFMQTLDEQTETYEFAEGDKQTPGEWFREFLSSFAEHPLFKEMVPPDDKKLKDASEFADDEKEADEIAEGHMPDND